MLTSLVFHHTQVGMQDWLDSIDAESVSDVISHYGTLQSGRRLPTTGLGQQFPNSAIPLSQQFNACAVTLKWGP